MFVNLKTLLQKVLHVFQVSIKMNNLTNVCIPQLHMLTKGTLKAQLHTQGCTAFISIKKLTQVRSLTNALSVMLPLHEQMHLGGIILFTQVKSHINVLCVLLPFYEHMT